MASGISGEFTLNSSEIWCSDDDPAPDVLEWGRVSAMRNELRK